MAHPYQKFCDGAGRAAHILKRADGGSVEKQAPVARSSKEDMEPKSTGSRYGGADLPTAPKGTNERAFYDARDNLEEK